MQIGTCITVLTLSALFVTSNVHAIDINFGAKFGGSFSSPDATFNSIDRSTSSSGLQVFALDLAGPPTIWSIRPLIAYEYHYAGSESSVIEKQSDLLSLGIQRVVPLGKAKAAFSLSATHFADTYIAAGIRRGERTTYLAEKWGVSIGVELQFAFFDHIEAVFGYKFHKREKPTFSTQGIITERSHVIEGREIDNSLFAGVVLRFGSV